jgi:Mn2+/Fe2+ NRAMP family transporter
MLAAAVLPLATAYAITEALGLEKGLDLDFGEAPIFMGLFTGLIALGVLIALIIPRGTVIQVLIFVQVIDCLLLPFVLFSILRLVNDRTLMGNMVNGPVYNAVARTVAALVTALSLALLVTTLLPTVGLG